MSPTIAKNDRNPPDQNRPWYVAISYDVVTKAAKYLHTDGRVFGSCRSPEGAYTGYFASEEDAKCALRKYQESQQVGIGTLVNAVTAESQCPDCKGTGEYRGLFEVGPCKTCCGGATS